MIESSSFYVRSTWTAAFSLEWCEDEEVGSHHGVVEMRGKGGLDAEELIYLVFRSNMSCFSASCGRWFFCLFSLCRLLCIFHDRKASVVYGTF